MSNPSNAQEIRIRGICFYRLKDLSVLVCVQVINYINFSISCSVYYKTNFSVILNGEQVENKKILFK